MENKEKNNQESPEQVSDEALEEVSGGNKATFENATENATVNQEPVEGAGEKGVFFKFKKKKFFHHHHGHH
ncbi:MAG: hypothetical protein AAFQ40_04305 [Cyanobacteria bacterium J06623_5]